MKAFYQSIHYEPLRDRKLRRGGPVGANVTFSASNPAARAGILDYFEEISVQRVGILHGEYLLHGSGMMVIERNGVITSVCLSLENYLAAQYMATESRRSDLTNALSRLLEQWDSLALVRNMPLLSDIYKGNYYHFSLEFVPRARYFCEQVQTPTLIIPNDALSRPFQRDLLKRSMPGMSFLPLESPFRVRDPILAHDAMSDEGMLWLRRASGISAQPGHRKIYISRGGRGTRSTEGGGISESVGFAKLLRDFGFETVDFGNGQHGVAEQVAMLEGVGLILAAHGAALTNLVYLNPKLTVIEVMGPRTANACFMHIASTLGFEYHGLFSSNYDDQSNIIVDLDELYEVVSARL